MGQNRPLWAPWRIEFIRGAKNEKCFLCGCETREANPDSDELIIFRGKHCFVILNRFPYNSGHLMVVPYRHTGDISELNADERTELFDLSIKAKEVLEKAMAPQGFNAGFNLGTAAGAGCADHLHMHVVPRWVGDTNFMPVLGDVRCVPEALLETVKLLKANWN